MIILFLNAKHAGETWRAIKISWCARFVVLFSYIKDAFLSDAKNGNVIDAQKYKIICK